MTDNNFYENQNLEESSAEIPAEQVPQKIIAEPKKEFKRFFPFGLTEKGYGEYKEIKRVSKANGASFLFMNVLMIVVSFALSFIFATLKIGNMSGTEFLDEPAIRQVQQILFSMIYFLIPFLVCFKLAKFRISDLVSYKKVEKKLILPLFLMGVSFCSFANIAVSYAAAIFQSFGIDYNVDFGPNPTGFFGFCLTFISTVVTPALVEEFICRGLILGSLRRFGDGFAIIVSAILFGLMHGNFQQIPFAFLVGLVLGFIVVKSGSLWVAVAVHAFNNFISVSFDYIFASFSDNAQNMIYTFILAICLLTGIIAVLLLKNADSDFYKIEKAQTELTEKQKYKWFFKSPTIVIFIVFALIESVTFFFI